MLSRFAFTVLLSMSFASAADEPKPPAFIKPYPGQKPYGDAKMKEFDEVLVPVAKLKDDNVASPEWKKLEGKVLQFHFDMPEGRSTLEVFKNYEEALQKAGFEKVFSCSDKGCGSFGGFVPTWEGAMSNWTTHQARYTLGKLDRPEGAIWAAVFVSPIGLPLTEVKKLLEGSPALKLYVVGHTDDVGTESANVALSNSRAASVVKELTTRYKIAPGRLKSAGVGPYVPVASNRNEQGRARNRRVVLVEDVP
jgi:OOP family OmpA-OmpF porin